jgi:hypothetical protein
VTFSGITAVFTGPPCDSGFQENLGSAVSGATLVRRDFKETMLFLLFFSRLMSTQG